MDPGPSTMYSWTLGANLTKRNSSQKRKRRSTSTALRNIVGCRFSHDWKDGDGQVTQWKGTILQQVPINPALYLVKYDGVDCVYGLELHRDERVLSLKILPERVQESQVPDHTLPDTLVGKVVEHLFEGEDGSKDEWRGLVLAQAPIMNGWFYITYEKDPVLYMYQLLDDLKEGNLRIMHELDEDPEPDLELEFMENVVGNSVQSAKDNGNKKVGKVIHQVEARPSVYLVKFDDDVHIYVYDLVKHS